MLTIEQDWRDAACARVSLRINRGLNGGHCPEPGALGECPALYVTTSSDDGSEAWCAAEVYLWRRATDFKPATLAQWIKEAGGLDLVISHVLLDEWNDTAEGKCSDGTVHWRAEFRVERPC